MLAYLRGLVIIYAYSICTVALQVDVADQIIFSVGNYPFSLPRNKTHIWEFKVANGSQIVIRMRHIRLLQDDELKVFDNLPDSRTELGSFSSRNIKTNKIVSSGDSIALELISRTNISISALNNDSQIFAFNFTLEVAGFCSPNNIDRESCKDLQHHCYSLSEDSCDGFWDCPLSGVDENNCSCPSVTEFACANFATSASCYDLSQRCDGVYHCTDKSDEMGCLESQCSLEALRFLCLPLNGSVSSVGECIALDRICDDRMDCANGADEAPRLCRDFSPVNASVITFTSVRQSRIAQLFAAHLARESVKDAVAVALSRVDSRLRTLLTYVLSALFGPLLIILTVGLMCRSSSAVTDRRSADEVRRARQQARFNSPIQSLIREEIRRRPPPPTYEEALNNSLFEEPILDGVALRSQPEPAPGALSQDRIAAIRELSMKPAPTRVDVAISCDLSDIFTSPSSCCRQTVATALPSPFARSSSTMLAAPTEVEENDAGDVSSSCERTSGQSLLGRWLMSTLVSWRRGGFGGVGVVEGLRSDHDQPEVSEATVVSSMHEEEATAEVCLHESVEEMAEDEFLDGAYADVEQPHGTTMGVADAEGANHVMDMIHQGSGGDNNDRFPDIRTRLLTRTRLDGASPAGV